ncbi:MAG: hypothetical protein RIC19_02290 [Phaeodactylibacter sp.]|uniref:hypothetical protein n=1 Tax=Phaeodactylibacter sp. TaxID=1940289 RepID=UPI0032EB4A5E
MSQQQILILSRQGYSLQADGALFPRHWLLHHSMRDDFPLLDSIWDALIDLPPDQFPVSFRFVDSPHPVLIGYYHLTVHLVPQSPFRLRLTIERCTFEALRLRKKLQLENTAALYQQQREFAFLH